MILSRISRSKTCLFLSNNFIDFYELCHSVIDKCCKEFTYTADQNIYSISILYKSKKNICCDVKYICMWECAYVCVCVCYQCVCECLVMTSRVLFACGRVSRMARAVPLLRARTHPVAGHCRMVACWHNIVNERHS